jgi:hypothetical protein
MENEELIREKLTEIVGKQMFIPVRILMLLSVLTVISSPFIMIWQGWNTGLAVKIFLTGILCRMLFSALLSFLKGVVDGLIDKALSDKSKKENSTKSKFQQKIERMRAEAEAKLN